MTIPEKIEILKEKIPQVYEAGKKSEHDKFWDSVQWNGERTYYYQGFAGTCFNFKNFYPKRDINIVGNGQQFMYNWKNGMGQEDKDNIFESLKTRLEECNVTLNTGGATSLSSAFSYGTFIELPTIDLSNLTQASSQIFAYNYNSLKTIEKIIISENTVISSNWFTQDTGLENLTIEGTIVNSGFSVKDCKKLSVASLLSILTALSKDQSIASGKTVTFADNHLSLIQADEECLEQLSSAAGAGWSIFFGTTKYEG